MNNSSFHKILSNVDVLIHIYKLLDIQDQLRFSLASLQLRQVFEEFIWNYRTLQIFDRSPYFVITNDTGVKRIFFEQHQELEYFVDAYADTVQDLTLTRPVAHSTASGIILRDGKLNLRKFHNLRTLSCYKIILTTDHLKSLAKNHSQLLELNLAFCSIRDRKDLFINEILPKLKNLKHLSILDKRHWKLTHDQFQKIVKSSKLETLALSAVIILNEEIDNFVPKNFLVHPTGSNLKMLEISIDSHCLDFPICLFRYSITFQTLVSLQIHFKPLVNEEILTTIAENCKQLEIFKIMNTIFTNIKTFSVPPKVTDLSLMYCDGLTWNNLQQILTQFQIIKFTSKRTIYGSELDFQDFRISPFIQYLNIDAMLISDFKGAYENNANLKELIWQRPCTDEPQASADFQDVPLPLTGCHSLQHLHTPDLSLDILLQLNSLKKLKLFCPVFRFEWPYIVTLLQHQSVKELTIEDFYELVSDDPAEVKEAFATNIEHLTITKFLFFRDVDFWFNLFNRNKKLTLECRLQRKRDMLHLREIIRDNKIPETLRTIDICGYTIKCDDFRNDDIFYQLRDKWIIYPWDRSDGDPKKCEYPFRFLFSWK